MHLTEIEVNCIFARVEELDALSSIGLEAGYKRVLGALW